MEHLRHFSRLIRDFKGMVLAGRSGNGGCSTKQAVIADGFRD